MQRQFPYFVIIQPVILQSRDIIALSFLLAVQRQGPTVRQLTVFFTTFVFLQFWNLFNAKGFEAGCAASHGIAHSRTFLTVLALIALGQWLIVELGGEVFRTVPLSWQEWAWIVGLTSLIALGGEAIRALRRRQTCSCRDAR